MINENDLLNVVEKELLNFMDELLEHSKKVTDLAIEISNKIDNGSKVIISERDKELIEVATLLHDVKKFKGKNHPEIGARYIKHYLNDVFMCNKDEKALIRLMVRWHKGSGYKKSNYDKKKIRMIEIVRIADKISKIYKMKKSKKLIKVYPEIEENINKLKDKKLKIQAEQILSEKLFSRLGDLYQSGRIKKKGLKKCCKNGLITKEQKKRITDI